MPAKGGDLFVMPIEKQSVMHLYRFIGYIQIQTGEPILCGLFKRTHLSTDFPDHEFMVPLKMPTWLVSLRTGTFYIVET